MSTFYGECERARQWISAGLDGELSEFEAALLDGHLAACHACGEFLVDTRAVASALRNAPLEDFRGQVTPRRRRRIALRLSPVAASLAVVAVGIGSILASVRVGPFVGNAVRRTPSATSELGDTPTNVLRQARDQRRVKITAIHARQPKSGPVLHS